MSRPVSRPALQHDCDHEPTPYALGCACVHCPGALVAAAMVYGLIADMMASEAETHDDGCGCPECEPEPQVEPESPAGGYSAPLTDSTWMHEAAR